MKHLLAPLFSLICCAGLFAADPPAATQKPAAPPRQQADVAAPKVDRQGNIDKGFAQKHQRFIERAKKGDVDLLFLGDSITEGWAGNGKDVWAKNYADKKAANFGIGGDRTQHVLWRIENGELDGISPKVVVLMIGTNNTGSDSVQSIASGITKIVQTIRSKCPTTKVLLLAIFPRAEKADNPVRAKIAQINEIIAKLDDGKNVRYLDIGPKFLTPDGTLTQEIMRDRLHPTKAGYEIWTQSIKDLLDEMMK